jgi:hypothetical protein
MTDYKQKYERLRDVVELIYTSGIWHSDAVCVPIQRKLWARVRDAADIAPGTATDLGLADLEPVNTVEMIGVIRQCRALLELNLMANATQVDSGMLKGCTNLGTIGPGMVQELQAVIELCHDAEDQYGC